jgi:16S rRNA (guanine(1405)-N(7))-methyltransferase
MTELYEKISHLKKYRSLSSITIQRTINTLSHHYPSKQLEQQVKAKLHQIWGAYYTTRPNFTKLLSKIQEQYTSGLPPKEILRSLLLIHASTNERLPLVDTFYSEIFKITGVPDSIIDYACGFNPLTLPWMQLPATTKYTAYDIDTEEILFLNDVIHLLHLHTEADAKVHDIFEYKDEYADIIFLFKLLPVLEQQQKGITQELLTKLHAKHLVITFPTASITGKNKHMQSFYTTQTETLLTQQHLHYQVIQLSSETIFIVRK